MCHGPKHKGATKATLLGCLLTLRLCAQAKRPGLEAPRVFLALGKAPMPRHEGRLGPSLSPWDGQRGFPV
jgi:hypothetical protein